MDIWNLLSILKYKFELKFQPSDKQNKKSNVIIIFYLKIHKYYMKNLFIY